MKRIATCFLGAVLMSALVSVPMFAQGTAQINGTVTDATGALLPGVDVTVTQTETSATRSGISNETGAFILQNIPIGPYQFGSVAAGLSDLCTDG